MTTIMNGEYITIWRVVFEVCLEPLSRHLSRATEEVRIAGNAV